LALADGNNNTRHAVQRLGLCGYEQQRTGNYTESPTSTGRVTHVEPTALPPHALHIHCNDKATHSDVCQSDLHRLLHANSAITATF